MKGVGCLIDYSRGILLIMLVICSVVFCSSCATPSTTGRTTITVDEDPLGGGINSSDIRTLATKMTPELLALPEISGSPELVRIAISPMKNSSRFIMDMNLFMKRFRLELNKYSGGKVRFFSQRNAQVTRKSVLDGRTEAALEESLSKLADALLSAPVVANASKPPKIAIIPVLNCNFVNMNADSFVAMLRASIASKANGKVQFLLPGTVKNADYYLTGQFIAETMIKHGVVNLTDYINIIEERLEKGESLSVYDNYDFGKSDGQVSNSGHQVIIDGGVRRRSSVLEQIMTNSQLMVKPNVTKRLNVMLAGKDDGICAFEKMITIEKKITDGLGRADYILSGEITGLSKRVQGDATDYLLITFQLVDPETNEVLWEGGHEVKKKSNAGIVYQ